MKIIKALVNLIYKNLNNIFFFFFFFTYPNCSKPKLYLKLINAFPIHNQWVRNCRSNTWTSNGGDYPWFQPVLEAATSMVVKMGYALLCLVVIMLIVHVIGAVLFHFLRTRHKFPVHRVFISTQPPCGALHTQNLPPPKDSDTDSDDNDGFKTYTSQRGTLTRHQGAPPAETLPQGDFQYSETKV